TISDDTSVRRLVIPSAHTVRWTIGTRDLMRPARPSAAAFCPLRAGRVSRPAQSIAYIEGVSANGGEPGREARSPPLRMAGYQQLRRLGPGSLPKPALISGGLQTFRDLSPSALSHDGGRSGLEKEGAGRFRAVDRGDPDVDDGRLRSAAG